MSGKKKTYLENKERAQSLFRKNKTEEISHENMNLATTLAIYGQNEYIIEMLEKLKGETE